MRKLYISVAAFFLISLTAFVYSFVYLDKDKHRTYHYVVNHDGQNIGILKLDLYLTEEKRIYKSSAEFPFDPVFNRSRSRLDLDRKYLMDSYLSESYNSDSSELIYIEKKNKAVSCLGRFMSGFIFIENMPMKNDTFIFEESSILTYFPIIENYDFKRGRSQGFNAMIPTY